MGRVRIILHTFVVGLNTQELSILCLSDESETDSLSQTTAYTITMYISIVVSSTNFVQFPHYGRTWFQEWTFLLEVN